jgi:hypothetical protein
VSSNIASSAMLLLLVSDDGWFIFGLALFLISVKVENEIKQQNDNDSITQRVRYEVVDEGVNDDGAGRLLLTPPRALDDILVIA